MPTEITRQQIEDLCAAVANACPDIEKTGIKIDAFVTTVMDEAGGVFSAIQKAIAAANGGVGHEVAIAVAIQGALAAVFDELPSDNPQSQCYRAGRLIGRFYVDRIAETIGRAAQQVPQ